MIILNRHATEYDIFIRQEFPENLWHSICTAYLENQTLVRHTELQHGGALLLLGGK